MARPGPNRRLRCYLHSVAYLTWADAKHTKLGRCPECEAEDARAAAAAERRAEQAQARAEGDA